MRAPSGEFLFAAAIIGICLMLVALFFTVAADLIAAMPA